MGSVIDTLLLRAVELKASDLHQRRKTDYGSRCWYVACIERKFGGQESERENGQYGETGYAGVDSFTHFAVAESQNLFLDKGKAYILCLKKSYRKNKR